MVSQDVENELEEAIEGSGRTLEWAIEEYEQNYEEIESRSLIDLPEEEKHDYALADVEAEITFQDRTFSSGDEMELEILAIGQAGRIDNWGEDNDSVVYSYGFVYGPLGEDGKERVGKAIMVNRASDGVDLDNVQRAFHAENTLKAVYEVNESNDLPGVYRCFSNETTEIVEQELDNLPADREDKLEVLRQAIPEAKLANLEDQLSAYDPETGYTYDFGADLKRIQGQIVDHYIADDGSWGRYTVMDDSVTQDDIVDTPLADEDAAVPGLTVWADPDFHMEYGRKTRGDFIGTVEEGSNGNIVMNLVGIIPIIPMPLEEDEEKADSQANTTESSL